MRSEHRSDLEASQNLVHEIPVEVGFEDPVDGRSQISLVGCQLISAMNLFGDIGEVEVSSERPDQGDHLIGGQVREEFMQFCGGLGASPTSCRLSKRAHLLHQGE